MTENEDDDPVGEAPPSRDPRAVFTRLAAKHGLIREGDKLDHDARASDRRGTLGYLIGFCFWSVIATLALTVVTLGQALPLLIFCAAFVLPVGGLIFSALCWRIFVKSIFNESTELEDIFGARSARTVGLFAVLPGVVFLVVPLVVLRFAWQKLS